MRTLINKIKVFLNRYNPIEITRLLKCIEKEIYNINKVIGSVRNVDIKLIQKDVELLMNVIEKRLPPYALNKEDDEIKALENGNPNRRSRCRSQDNKNRNKCCTSI